MDSGTHKAPGNHKAVTKSRPKPRRKPARAPGEWWSQRVTQSSDALKLVPKVFSGDDPRALARSLKWSAEHSRARKSSPYRSAMSMLTFYINRAGKRLPKRRLKVLEQAKGELRELFHRTR